MSKKLLKGISRNVVAISLVSFLNDIASEMIYPLVPIFLVNVLHSSVAAVGLIEGIAEATANIMRVFSGYFSDLFGRRKPFMIAGYSLSTISKIVIGVATGWFFVLNGRFLDRFGKGIRTSARDALIVDSSDCAYRGKVFGFHRGLDTLGAMIGPLLALLLLKLFEENLRLIFYLACLPGLAGIVLLIVFVKDSARINCLNKLRLSLNFRDAHLSRNFKIFLLASTIFALGNSSDAFLILKAHSMGFTVTTIILVYTLFNIVYALCSFPAGIISDRIGQRKILLAGFALFAIVYFLFGITAKPVYLWFIFPLYGVYMALTEGIGKAYISLHADDNYTATTYGIYQTVTGLAAFPASLWAGLLWKYFGSSSPFFFGAAMALLALGIFSLVKEKK